MTGPTDEPAPAAAAPATGTAAAAASSAPAAGEAAPAPAAAATATTAAASETPAGTSGDTKTGEKSEAKEETPKDPLQVCIVLFESLCVSLQHAPTLLADCYAQLTCTLPWLSLSFARASTL